MTEHIQDFIITPYCTEEGCYNEPSDVVVVTGTAQESFHSPRQDDTWIYEPEADDPTLYDKDLELVMSGTLIKQGKDFIGIRFLCSDCHNWYKIEQEEATRYRKAHGNGEAFT
ncbi:hypothetical protein KAR91_77480 [Candidatus Pacearchaeota archaeon]|nr:hypothetical protein [Candidatus Pacearchaeota archaeon]